MTRSIMHLKMHLHLWGQDAKIRLKTGTLQSQRHGNLKPSKAIEPLERTVGIKSLFMHYMKTQGQK